MDDELVLLTSYFNLVDGRRQDNTDTFRVDTHLPSASSPDGSGALYIITEASTAGHVGPRARRLAADTIAWEYASREDGLPPGRLKAALHAAHAEILREFDGHVAVGATVMAVERDDVYLAQVAPSHVYVLHEGRLNSLPASSDGSSPFVGALGSRGIPQVSVFRDQIAHGDVIGLCSTWFDRSADVSDLRECFAAGTSDEIAECLLDLAQRHDVRDATSIIVEAALSRELEVVPTGEEAPKFMEQLDIAVQALASVGRMLLNELRPPTSGGRGASAPAEPMPSRTHASPITSEVPLVEVEAPSPSAESDTRGKASARDHDPERHDRTVTFPLDAGPARESSHDRNLSGQHEGLAVQRPLREDSTEETPAVPTSHDHNSVSTPETHRGDAPGEVSRRAEQQAEDSDPLSEIEQVNSRIHSADDIGHVIPPVQAFEEASTEPARIYATSKDIDAVNRRPRRFGGAGSVPVIRPGLGDVDLRQPVSRPTPPALIWASAAAFLIVTAVGFGLYVAKHRPSHHTNPFPARMAANLARARGAGAAAQQDYYLGRAKQDIALARQNGSTPTTVRDMTTTWLTTSDSLHHITHVRSPILLTDFARFPGAQPMKIAAATGLVYVIDAQRKSVFSVAANPNSNPRQVVQVGETYSGFTVGVPQHVATDGATALILDDKNILIRDTGGTKTATSLTQQTQSRGHVVAMSASDPDVYLLDAGSSQVWRYPYAVSGYNPAQAAYWDTNPPKLGDAVSLAFDKTNLYVLKDNGTVLKFDFQAKPQKFSLSLKTPILKPAAFYTDPTQRWVWIADPAHGRIVQLDKSGAYSHTYASSNALDLTGTKSISVGPDGKTMYVLAGSRLYDFPVAP